MYLVKSCYQRDHLLVSGTIKIGSLNEYKEHEESQIVDAYEGTYDLHIKLENYHMHNHLWNYLNFHHDSLVMLNINSMDYYYKEVLFQGCFFIHKLDASITLSNKNRFIFCMSRLQSGEDAIGMFNNYDSYWSFNEKHAWEVGDLIGKSLKREVINRLKQGEQIFEAQEGINPDKIEAKQTLQYIDYTPRSKELTNIDFYTNQNFILSLFKKIKFIKPAKFSPEKEIRYVFDFYYNDKLLHPKINFIIISAPNLSFILKK
ncbi:hypothetical protein [Enterobacter sp. DE0047]|uniref:hypothetical protein n=1 Tax=Enterobacter sp. DE0047 TaxID=2584949 RepID=UPI00119CE87E|nr:hypothetical protein [Enterobacter sp. DE0047]